MGFQSPKDIANELSIEHVQQSRLQGSCLHPRQYTHNRRSFRDGLRLRHMEVSVRGYGLDVLEYHHDCDKQH